MLESIILRKEYRWKLKRNIGGDVGQKPGDKPL